MIRPLKNFLPVLLAALALLFLAPPSAAAWKWTHYLRRGTIEGYVFVDKRLEKNANAMVSCRSKGRIGFLKGILKDYKNKRPLENATVSLGTTGLLAETNAYGYFKIDAWWPRLKRKSVTVSARGICLTFKPDWDDRISNFVYIGIPSDGKPNVFCLDASIPSGEPSNAVVLVHGFGIDIGRFTPSPEGNSWRKAYALFESDPDLSAYDFYMVDHWDDQDLVQSSLELACFLRMLKQAYPQKGGVIVMGHSAGGLIVRHYTVSPFFEPGAVTRFLMLATPNHGSLAALLHFEPDPFKTRNVDGDGTAAMEILPGSPFLDCLNRRSKRPDECSRTFKIDRNLQDARGLNPDIPCAILAGEVMEKLKEKAQKEGKALGVEIQELFGNGAGNWFDGLFQGLSSRFFDKMQQGDLLVSLKSQLIEGVPHAILPYAHGFLQTPDDTNDVRYRAMKNFILKGKLDNNEPKSETIAI